MATITTALQWKKRYDTMRALYLLELDRRVKAERVIDALRVESIACGATRVAQYFESVAKQDNAPAS